jgi:hypothetical protein
LFLELPAARIRPAVVCRLIEVSQRTDSSWENQVWGTNNPAQVHPPWDVRADDSFQAIVNCLEGNPDAYFISVDSRGRMPTRPQEARATGRTGKIRLSQPYES